MNDQIKDYLRQLESALQGVPDAARSTILEDVRLHIDEATDQDRDPAEVLAALGPADDVAREAREQLGVPDSTEATATAPERAARMLHLSAVILAVITAVFVSFLLPSFATEELSVSSDATGSTLQTATSLFEAYGLIVALLPLLPAGLGVLPLVLRPRWRRPVALVNAVIMTVFSIIAGFSIGGFFIPLSLLLWAAVLVPRWLQRGEPTGPGLAWRLVGAVAIVSPAVLTIVGLLTDTFTDGGAAFWITALVVFAIGVLFALRIRFVDTIVTVLGAALMLLAVIDAGLLVLAVWLGGGLWLVIGLAAIAAFRYRAIGTGTRRRDGAAVTA